MSNRTRWIAGGGAVAALAAAAVTVRTATGRWHRRTAELVHRMLEAPGRRAKPTQLPLALQTLPDPVRRYFAAALRRPAGALRAARLESAGTFRQVADGTGTPDSGWFPFTATQTFTVEPPAFVWAATMQMRPFVKVFVRDTYVDGRGSMQGSALGIVPVVEASSAPELNAGALLRYLAEAAWVPPALLPSERLRWEPVDDRHAKATLTDGSVTVSAVFEFNGSGDIVGVSAARARATDRGYETTPWEGRFWEHQERDGMRIPTRGEVAWILDGTRQPYWRGELRGAEYDFPAAAAADS